MSARVPDPRMLPLVLLALLLAACERGGTLPEPDYATATCAQCEQRIARRDAAQFQRADGTVVSFDRPICLFRALRAEADEPRAIRVHDAGDGWIAAEDAWFATVPAPAGGDEVYWAAFPSFGAAQDAVAQAGRGEILPFAQARARVGR